MKKHFLILSLFLLPFITNAAHDNPEDKDDGKIIIILRTYMAENDPSELRNLNDQFLKQLDFDAKITDDFPVTPLYKIDVNLLKPGNFMLTAGLFFHSTGSRINYEDYSGEYNADMILNTFGMSIGMTAFIADLGDYFKLGYNLETGMIQKSVNFVTSVRIGNETMKEGEPLDETSLYFQPGLTVAYFHDYFFAGLDIGYLIDFNGELLDNHSHIYSFKGIKYGLSFGINTNLFKSIF